MTERDKIKKQEKPNLIGKRDLIMHTYDLLRTAQARIYTLAKSTYDYTSIEIDTTQKILFLDDVLQFSISARRLIELTYLKSFSNQQNIVLQHFDNRESPTILYPGKQKIGFLTLANSIIHGIYIDLFLSRFDIELFYGIRQRTEADKFAQYKLFEKLINENRWHEYAIEPAMLVKSDKEFVGIVLLKDLVNASVDVVEKIIDVCSDSNIFLGADFRI
jgi:hypothetical protein